MTSKELEKLIELKVSECLNKVLINDYIAKVMKESLNEVLKNEVSLLIKEELSKTARTENYNHSSLSYQRQIPQNNDLREIVKNGVAVSRMIMNNTKENKIVKENKEQPKKIFGGVDIFADISDDDANLAKNY